MLARRRTSATYIRRLAQRQGAVVTVVVHRAAEEPGELAVVGELVGGLEGFDDFFDSSVRASDHQVVNVHQDVDVAVSV